MAQATNFEEFFNRSRAEVPKPRPLPRGNYTLAMRGTFKRPPREEGKSGQLSFFYEAIEPHDDVDPNELAEFEGEGRSIKDNRITVEFWTGDWGDIDKVWDHLALLGVAVDDAADLGTALKMAQNKRVVAYVSPETYNHKVKGPQTKDVAQGFKALQ